MSVLFCHLYKYSEYSLLGLRTSMYTQCDGGGGGGGGGKLINLNTKENIQKLQYTLYKEEIRHIQ